MNYLLDNALTGGNLPIIGIFNGGLVTTNGWYQHAGQRDSLCLSDPLL